MRLDKRIIMLGAFTLAAFGLTGCGEKSKETTEVNIGYFNNVTHAQALLMKSEQSLKHKLQEQ